MVERAAAFLKVKLADWAEAWLLNIRQEYRPESRALTADETAELRGYFGQNLLSLVRVAVTERIPNPSFFAGLPQLGLPIPWNFSTEPSLAAVDTILISKPLVPKGRLLSILFEECVHLQQFQALGASRLVSHYVHGLFENGFNYRGLPMERQARELQFRFDAGLKMFSVEREVEAALVSGAI